MSRRFGKARVPDCTCEYNFTCRACLQNAPLIAPAVHAPQYAEHITMSGETHTSERAPLEAVVLS